MTFRDWAIHYARDLLSLGWSNQHGYANSKGELFDGIDGGGSSPGEPGYLLKSGVMTVPWNGAERFEFRQLADDVTGTKVQTSLFDF